MLDVAHFEAGSVGDGGRHSATCCGIRDDKNRACGRMQLALNVPYVHYLLAPLTSTTFKFIAHCVLVFLIDLSVLPL